MHKAAADCMFYLPLLRTEANLFTALNDFLTRGAPFYT